MKLRADKIYYPAPDKTIEKIQERIQDYTPELEFKENMDSLDSDIKKANYILNLYLKIAYDEGYSYGLKEIKSDNKDSHLDSNMKIKNRKKNKLNNILEKNEEKEITSLVQRRIKSKRMRKFFEKTFSDKGMSFEEEMFALSIAIHSGYEFGYSNSQSLDNTINFMLGEDKEKVDMFKDLFQDLLKTQ